VATGDGASRAAVVPLRWNRHGVDVCAVIDDTGLSFVARDVLEALGHDTSVLQNSPAHAWAAEHAAPTQRDHAAGARWTRQQLHDILGRDTADADTADFLAWIGEQVEEFHRIGLDNLARITLDGPRPARPAPPADTEPAAQPEPTPAEHYSVAATAKILDRDPAISIGRDALFDLLHKWGWIEKRADVWTPNRDVVFLGYLTTVENRIPNSSTLYPQVCITPVGIAALHQRLGGIAELNLSRSHLTLI
jgi:hypothetical protein